MTLTVSTDQFLLDGKPFRIPSGAIQVENKLVVFELQGTQQLTVEFRDKPELG